MFGQLSQVAAAVVGQQAKAVKKSGWGFFGGWGESQPEEPVQPPPPPARESLFSRKGAQPERSPMPVSPQASHQRGAPSFGDSGRRHPQQEAAQPASLAMQAPLFDRKSAHVERPPVPASPRAGHQKGLPSLGGSGGVFSGMDSLDPSSAATGYHPHPHPQHAPTAPPSPKPETNELLGLNMGQANGESHPDPEGVFQFIGLLYWEVRLSSL